MRNIVLGVVAKPHGIRGIVSVKIIVPEFASLLKHPVYVADKRVHVVRFLPNSIALCKVDGIDDRDAAMLLRRQNLLLDEKFLPALGEGEFYYHQLHGMQVVDSSGAQYGAVTNVEDHGAGPCLTIDDKYLLAFAGPGVLKIDAGNNLLVIDAAHLVGD